MIVEWERDRALVHVVCDKNHENKCRDTANYKSANDPRDQREAVEQSDPGTAYRANYSGGDRAAKQGAEGTEDRQKDILNETKEHPPGEFSVDFRHKTLLRKSLSAQRHGQFQGIEVFT